MFKCPVCGSEKFVNSVGNSGLVRTCRNPLCNGLGSPNYSFPSAQDEFHLKSAVEASQEQEEPAPEPEPKKRGRPVSKKV